MHCLWINRITTFIVHMMMYVRFTCIIFLNCITFIFYIIIFWVFILLQLSPINLFLLFLSRFISIFQCGSNQATIMSKLFIFLKLMWKIILIWSFNLWNRLDVWISMRWWNIFKDLSEWFSDLESLIIHLWWFSKHIFHNCNIATTNLIEIVWLSEGI